MGGVCCRSGKLNIAVASLGIVASLVLLAICSTMSWSTFTGVRGKRCGTAPTILNLNF